MCFEPSVSILPLAEEERGKGAAFAVIVTSRLIIGWHEEYAEVVLVTNEEKMQVIVERHLQPAAIPDGNIAPMGAISRTDSEEAVMTKEEFRAERLYLVSLSVAKSMLQKGIISKKEYRQMDNILLEKYRPVLGTLLAGKRLNVCGKSEK